MAIRLKALNTDKGLRNLPMGMFSKDNTIMVNARAKGF